MTGKKSQSANGRTSKKTATNAMGRKQGSAPANPAANSNNRRRGGSVWRSGAAREEEGEAMPDRRSRDLAGELDFSDAPVRRRGFLDEDGF